MIEKPLTPEEVKAAKRIKNVSGRPPALSKKQIYEIRRFYRKWAKEGAVVGYKELAKKYKVTTGTIHNAIYGKGAYEGI